LLSIHIYLSIQYPGVQRCFGVATSLHIYGGYATIVPKERGIKMAVIKSIEGLDILIDDEDWVLVADLSWSAIDGYAYCKKVGTMHRLIMGTLEKRAQREQLQVHHINGNGLDNRRENLKVLTCMQHAIISNSSRKSNSGYRGVYWNKLHQKWEAQIWPNRKRTCLGFFDDPVVAAKAYDAAALQYFGENAILNFKEA
jgi:hypothetical protein